jgi:hypothetical protein
MGLRDLARPYAETALRPAGARLVAAAFAVDFAFVLVFVVALQSLLRHQYLGSHYLPALALSAYAAGKLTLQAPAGHLVDRVGARAAAVMAVGAVLVAQAVLAFGEAAPLLVLPCAFLYGGAGACFWPALYDGVNRGFAAEQRSLMTSALGIATGAGMAAALAVGAVLPGSFPFAGGLALACGGAALSLPLVAGITGGERPVVQRRPQGAAASGRVVSAAAVMLAQSAAVAALVAVFRAFGAEALHITFRTEVIALAVPGAALGAGILAAGLASQRLPRGAVLSPAFMVSGTALLVLGGASNALLALGVSTTAAFGLGFAIPTTTALVLDAARGTSAGRVLGVVLTFEGLGHVMGPLVAGLIGDPGLAVQAAGCMLLFAMAVSALLFLDARSGAAIEVGLAGETP